jgi:hypothetical protein
MIRSDPPSLAPSEHWQRNYWWCGFDDLTTSRGQLGLSMNVASGLLYERDTIPEPTFLPQDELNAAANEIRQLGRIGDARRYLANEAIAWARAAPRDQNAAEALSLIVNGWRWACGDGNDGSPEARQAFTTLHRLFPNSEWAAKTKYWYR